ncbi:MAG: RNA 2',3'-cyclic phosphodiesterase, partial [Proteobacteria bacterium]|nr:RNA 2',3'-cyclic phosphodiesterase [Pseudomonadota bacterium]
MALAIPKAIAQELFLLQAGIPGARWQTREQLHLTLRFIGEVDGRQANDIDDALAAISAPRFTLALKGVGEFGGKKPHAVWAGVSDGQAVSHLNRKIEAALQRIGVAADERRFTPHVTLARLRAAPVGKVMDWLADHAFYAGPPFAVEQFALYSSVLSP